MQVKCLSLEELWEMKYKLLMEFMGGNKRIPKIGEIYQGVKIGGWCNNNKTNYKNNQMSDERKQKLEAIEGWKWGEKKTTKTLTYDESYKILQDFVKEYERVPFGTEEYKGVNIGMWCGTQKRDYRNKKSDDYRKQKLESIQGWTWGEKRSKMLIWDESYSLLRDCLKEHTKMPVMSFEYHGVKIGRWCMTQRQIYRSGKMSDKHIQQLESMKGWMWGEKRTSKLLTWDEKYKVLQNFKKEHKRVPCGTEEYDGLNIGTWCACQKENYRNGKMDNELKEKLESIEGWTWGEKQKTKPFTWDESYIILQEIVKEYNRIPRDKEYYKEYNIGFWCSHQKSIFKNNKMSDERIKKLEAIHGWIWGEKRTKPLTWDENCEILRDFINNNNNRFPAQKEEHKGIKIGIWLSNQKERYKNKKLKDERKQKLEAIQGWTWGEKKTSKPLTWDANCAILHDFMNKNNNRFPAQKEEHKGIKIGVWLSNQRVIYKKNIMNNERIKKLEAIHGWSGINL